MTTGVLPCLIFATMALTPAAEGQMPTAVACPTCGLVLDKLASLSWPELDALYRASSPGQPPIGVVRGRAIYSQDQPLAKLKSSTAKALWLGKDFDPESSMLTNRWRFGNAVKARVYPAESYLDGGPSLVMDYRHTSPVIWRNVRDELREVAPGLYLGVMFKCEGSTARFGMFFALEACSK